VMERRVKTRSLSFCLLPLLVMAIPSCSQRRLPPQAAPEAILSDEARQRLDGLFKDGLFDAKGAQRVSVRVTLRSVWGMGKPITREGWLVRDRKDAAPQIYFTDGESIAAPPDKEITRID